GGAGRCRDGRGLRARRLARRGGLRQQAPLGDALRVRRARREEGLKPAMSAVRSDWGRERTRGGVRSDALVFFGATGDLAYKKIFPTLQSMVRRGTLNVPVIGVAKSGWTLDQL